MLSPQDQKHFVPKNVIIEQERSNGQARAS